MKIPLVFALIILSLTISASPLTCGPNLTTDGIAVLAGCPGNTYQVIVEPSTFQIYFNDNNPASGINANEYAGDGDVNDAWITGTVTSSLIPGFDAVWFQWGGALSGWTNKLFIGGVEVDSANPGPTMIFQIDGDVLPVFAVAGDGSTYYGNPSLNPDGVLAFYETQTTLSDVPEPSTMGFAVVGVGLMLMARRRRT